MTRPLPQGAPCPNIESGYAKGSEYDLLQPRVCKLPSPLPPIAGQAKFSNLLYFVIYRVNLGLAQRADIV